jgi:MGT family glycosyltransferase
MRILVASVPAAGHFNPLTGPAVELASRGHDVRWYAGPVYGAKAQALGIPVLPYRDAVEVTADNLNELYPERRSLKGPKAIEFDSDAFFSRPVRGYVDDIRAVREDFPFDAMLIDGAFMAGYLVAKRLDVPVFVLGSIAAPSIRDPNSVTPFFSLRPPRTPVGWLVNRVTRRMVIAGSRKGLARFNGVLAEEGLPPLRDEEFLDCTMQPDSARGVFDIGLPELEYPDVRWPSNHVWVGALAPHRTPAPATADPRIAAWPGRVVVVSQGTVDNHDLGKLIEPTLEALAGTDTLVVATTGGVGTRELGKKFPHANVIVQDYVDFGAVFPLADAYITNGGMGGVLDALTHGLPILAAGRLEGKGDINARLAYRGLAVDLRKERPSARAIRRGLDRLLADSDLHARVKTVQHLLAAVDSVGIIADGVERGVTTVGGVR